MNFKVSPNNANVIEDMVWMSARYCIGRHTIAAAMHAPSLAQFVHENPKYFEKKRSHESLDIIRNINTYVGWSDNLSVKLFNTADRYDALSVLLSYILKAHKHYNNFEFDKYDFDVDCIGAKVEEHIHEPKEGEHRMVKSISEMLMDLNPWIKLYQFLKPIYNVTYKGENDEEVTAPSIRFFTLGRTDITQAEVLSEHYVPCEEYIKNPYIDFYLAPNRILKIEKTL